MSRTVAEVGPGAADRGVDGPASFETMDGLPVAGDAPESSPGLPHAGNIAEGSPGLPVTRDSPPSLPCLVLAPEDARPNEANPADEPYPAIGEVVAGRYRIRRLVGSGGMGAVFEAEQLDPPRRVALKVLHPHLAQDRDHKQRFHREAHAAMRLSQPGSVAVYEQGEWAGTIYIVMEFLEGRSLDGVIFEEGPLPVARATDIVLQICDVLIEAHGLGILHGDLKPANVILLGGGNGRERVKVVDFGLALPLVHRQKRTLRTEGMVTGTPAYMPPEQLRGEALDVRSDLYSLGVIFYEMLCGKLPFIGTIAEYLVQTLAVDPLPPSKLRPVTLPPALEGLVMWAIAKRPQDRPGSVAEFARALRALDAAPG